MKREQILHLPSMPVAGPSYPHGPYRFIDREYFIVVYESDEEAIREAVPEPLEPAPGGVVYYEFIRMPDSSGFGDYTESGLVIPCTYEGQPCNFPPKISQNDAPPIAGGREIWGFPKKYAQPKLEIATDTLTGTLHYAGQLVAMGTMTYKHEPHVHDGRHFIADLTLPYGRVLYDYLREQEDLEALRSRDAELIEMHPGM